METNDRDENFRLIQGKRHDVYNCQNEQEKLHIDKELDLTTCTHLKENVS